MTNSIDRDQWLNVTSESRDRIEPFFFNFALGRNRTRDPRVPEPKRTPLGYILPINARIMYEKLSHEAAGRVGVIPRISYKVLSITKKIVLK
jgi:hypothetical protein